MKKEDLKRGSRKREAKNPLDLRAFVDGRDENNLAEFPIAALADSVPKGQKTLEFEDIFKDWSTGKEIVRRVCVTGNDKFGLPTAKDEDVLLALLQLTKLANNFSVPEVSFSKHQVIEILGWENRGWAYDRIEESLHRWKGVSIHYWNAWRDNARKAWCDSAAIGVIDYFSFSDGRRRKSAAGGAPGMSCFSGAKCSLSPFTQATSRSLTLASIDSSGARPQNVPFGFSASAFGMSLAGSLIYENSLVKSLASVVPTVRAN